MGEMRHFLLLCCTIALVAVGLATGTMSLVICGLLCAGINAATYD